MLKGLRRRKRRQELTTEELKRMAEMTFDDITPEETATFDEAAKLRGADPAQTLRSFREKGYNPYFRRTAGKEGYAVKISFTNNGTRLADAVAAMLADG